MLKPTSSSSSSARRWAIAAAVLLLCAAHVDLVHGGRPAPSPPAPQAHVGKNESCENWPICDDNPPPSSMSPPFPPAPSVASDVPTPAGT